MNHLAVILPKSQKLRLPLSRDQLMLLMAAINEFFLGLDTYLAHVLNGTIRPREWIPILFGPTTGILLLLAGLIAIRKRPLASLLATLVLLASIIVGILGAYFHFIRAILPYAPPSQRITLTLLVWAPPILAPFSFALVGILGISAAWIEDPPDSGTLALPFGKRLELPYSKTRAYFFMVSMGTLIALVSSAFDHARTGWDNPWLWVPVAAGTFGAVVAAGMGALDNPTRQDILTYALAMVLLIVVGLLGAFFHIQADLTSKSVFVPERFLRGAPFLAPLLFANMGLLGLITLLDPTEKHN
ncbi:MAG: hypothetical protein D6706_05110 [Chloroflexi bacterium]|nr:MAG: hypothetical protein D6706_05110 [Chloroflexota bacterium]